ncbi:MAG: DUF481 domain-containing protein [Planctomycetota bacterium]|jgi:putative salt-induced outer membrane protein YdiY
MLLRPLLLLLLCASFARAETLEEAVRGYVAAADPEEKEPPKGKPWDIKTGLGLAFTDGNSNTLTLSANLEAVKEWDPWKSITKALITYAKSEGVETASEWILTERVERQLTEKSWLYADLWLEHDEFESLTVRIQLTAGYKRRLVKKEKFELFGDIGAGVVHHEYRVNPETEGIGDLGVHFTWKLTDRLTYEQVIRLFPSLSNGGEGRLFFQAVFTSPISQKMDLRLAVTDQYNSDPLPGIERNDLLITLSISIHFTKAEEKAK